MPRRKLIKHFLPPVATYDDTMALSTDTCTKTTHLSTPEGETAGTTMVTKAKQQVDAAVCESSEAPIPSPQMSDATRKAYEHYLDSIRQAAVDHFAAEERSDLMMWLMLEGAYRLWCLSQHDPAAAAKLEQECVAAGLRKAPGHAAYATRTIRMVMLQEPALAEKLRDRGERNYWKNKLNELANIVRYADYTIRGTIDGPVPHAVDLPKGVIQHVIDAAGGPTKTFRYGREVGRKLSPPRSIQVSGGEVLRLDMTKAQPPAQTQASAPATATKPQEDEALTDPKEEGYERVREVWDDLANDADPGSIHAIFVTVGSKEITIPGRGRGKPKIKTVPSIKDVRRRKLTSKELNENSISWYIEGEEVSEVELKVGQTIIKDGKFSVD